MKRLYEKKNKLVAHTVSDKIKISYFSLVCCTCMMGLLSGTTVNSADTKVVWKLDNPALIGGYKPLVLGNPSVVQSVPCSLFFNGVNDGLIFPVNPFEKLKTFTVEALFKPAADGPAAPRFVHFQDSANNRGTLEIRVTPQGSWYADIFLRNGKAENGLTLIDSTKLHACDRWYWLALVFDGKKMSSYVNGVKELEGDVSFEPMVAGQISLGVRLNRINWFKGQISELRFHPAPLGSDQLQRAVNN